MFKVILPAAQIPLNSIVTKRTGKKQYTLRDRLCVFDESCGTQELKARAGTRFLVSENGDARVVGDTVELVWHAYASALQVFIECQRFIECQSSIHSVLKQDPMYVKAEDLGSYS